MTQWSVVLPARCKISHRAIRFTVLLVVISETPPTRHEQQRKAARSSTHGSELGRADETVLGREHCRDHLHNCQAGCAYVLTQVLREVLCLRQANIVGFYDGHEFGLPADLSGSTPQATLGGMDNSGNGSDLAGDSLLYLLQAQATRFQLLTIAEHCEGTMRRAKRFARMESGSETAARGTFLELLSSAKSQGISPVQIQELLNRCRVHSVLTAHPTESKRISVLQIHRRIYRCLLAYFECADRVEQSTGMLAERYERLRAEVDLLWLTGDLFMDKPTVQREIQWGLFFFKESLYDSVPQVYQKLEQALVTQFPEHEFLVPPLLRLDSWIGGDRDGNPNVDNAVTRLAIESNAAAACELYQAKLRVLIERLSIAAHSVKVLPELLARLADMLALTTRAELIVQRNPGEVYRQYVVCMSDWLDNSKPDQSASTAGNRYRSAAEFVDDLALLERALNDSHCETISKALVVPLRRQVSVFGFRTVGLDVRENTSTINATLNEIRCLLEPHSAAEFADDSQRAEWIKQQLQAPLNYTPFECDLLSTSARETFGLFELIAEYSSATGEGSLSRFVLSMTQSASDVMAVYLLAKYAGAFSDRERERTESCLILVVPLLETIDDLRNSANIVAELLNTPLVRRTVRDNGGVQEVMVGYSDSNKDGGYFCANWEVNRAQKLLCAAGRTAAVPVSIFHGRGGSVSRGGVPTGRAIAAQPAATIDARMRLTEQGEVVSAKFANTDSAEYQLELMLAGVLEHSLRSEQETELKDRADFDEVMEALSSLSYVHYRKLAEMPDLVGFYQLASPVNELVLLKMGSRPARRFGADTLDDLRAIPWIFGWSQNRMMVPGWFGVGTALEQFLKIRQVDGERVLQQMFNESRLFRLLIDEVEKSLARVNLTIAREYVALANDDTSARAIFDLIVAEYHLTHEHILRLTGSDFLCQRFARLSRDSAIKLPVIDSVGHHQVALLKQLRATDKNDKDRLKIVVPLVLSINCVAAGIGWTG